MDLKGRIREDIKAAMRSRDTSRLGALRLIIAAITQREVDQRENLSDDKVIEVIDKMIKQRREAISQFEKGARKDLIEAEQFEISVLQRYMPVALSDEELARAIDAAILETGAGTVSDMKRVMAELKSRLAGRADMARVSAIVRETLSNR